MVQDHLSRFNLLPPLCAVSVSCGVKEGGEGAAGDAMHTLGGRR